MFDWYFGGLITWLYGYVSLQADVYLHAVSALLVAL